MPELPEVESIRRVLAAQLPGRRVEEVTLCRPDIIAHPAAPAFCAGVRGQTIDRLERRGKFLMLCLQNGARAVVHLRMTGCLLAAPAACAPQPHTHLIFHLDDGTQLRFSDARRFGRWWLLRAGETDTFTGMARLGAEPTDAALCERALKAAFATRKKPIKECLLDQSVLAGIGNIYSDEILFAARICPARPACGLSGQEWARLAQAIPERLRFFTEKNTVTPKEYLAGGGRDYRNTPFLQVYGHGGEPCPVCAAALCRAVIGGRSSVYCPVCQPAGGR